MVLKLPYADFKNGDIIFTRKPFSLFGMLIRNAQRDFSWEHVCEYYDGYIYSTGISGFPFWRFGKQPVADYLKGKVYAVGEFTGLSEKQIDVRRTNAMLLAGELGGKAMAYPWWKVVGLAAQGRFATQYIRQLGAKVQQQPKRVFCAGHVSLGLFRAGIPYGEINPKYPKKAEPDAFTPEVLFDSARVKIKYIP